ncbi:hypothetical protein AB0A63_22880 [Lentzea sp. NPDC042327]|uniref:hypothetical protein n=1 Tax=Lentzea sp. NPDC042327 TaxID=3154801 RepID=UPI0033C8CD57
MRSVKAIFGTAVLMAAALSATLTNTAAAVDGCVRTDPHPNSGTVYWVHVINACNYTLYNVDAHVYNGPAGIDKRSGYRANLKPGGWFELTGAWKAPAGSWTCGELWGPDAKHWGTDCVRM